MTNQDRNKHLCALLADAPHLAKSRTSSALRGAQVRWLLDLADQVDALGLSDTDEVAAAARTAAFGLVREAVKHIANPARPVL